MTTEIKAKDLRDAADRAKLRHHVDHVVEFQLIAAAINNTAADGYSKRWISDLIRFFGNIRNLQILPKNDNDAKRAAVKRLIDRNDAKEGDDDKIELIKDRWEDIKDQLKGDRFEQFKTQLDLLLDS